MSAVIAKTASRNVAFKARRLRESIMEGQDSFIMRELEDTEVLDFGEYGEWTGCGLFKHDDPRDRPASIFGGQVTLHTGPDKQAFVMLPVIPEK